MLTIKDVFLLKEAGFVAAEVGLQSYNSSILKIVNRPASLIELLKREGFGIITDLILGLPGETLRSFQNTMEFIDKYGLFEMSVLRSLLMLPGIELRKMKNKYGIEFDDNPPYMLSERDIQRCWDMFRALRVGKCSNSGRPLISSFSTYADKACLKNSVVLGKEEIFITKLILRLNANSQSKQRLLKLIKKINEKIANPLTVWFKSDGIEHDFELMAFFVKELSLSNPYLAWNIILETRNEFNLNIIDKIRGCFTAKEQHVLPLISVVISSDAKNMPAYWVAKLKKKAFLVRDIGVIRGSDSIKKSRGFADIDNEFILCDFPAGADLSAILNGSEFLKRKVIQGSGLFRKVKVNQMVFFGLSKFNECIAEYDDNFNLIFFYNTCS